MPITECVMKRQLHPKKILSCLKTWTALNPHVPKYSLTSLLHLLNYFFPTLSVDARILLKTIRCSRFTNRTIYYLEIFII